MKMKLHRLALASLVITLGSSCTTAYDAYGRPQQVIDPGTALIGAAAVGLIAYSLADSDDDHCRNDRRHHSARYRSSYGCYR